MIFLSTLLRKSIFDSEEHRLGILKDICVSLNETFPTVTALIVSPSSLSMGNSDMIIPWSQVEKLETERIHLTVKQSRTASYTPDQDELLLRRDLLDKQIVDTQGFRVVKVNDLKLAQIKGTARLIGADISFSGLYNSSLDQSTVASSTKQTFLFQLWNPIHNAARAFNCRCNASGTWRN